MAIHGRDFSKILSTQARKTPEKVAIFNDEENLTFAQLEDRVARCSAYLADAGVGKQDICALAYSDLTTLLIVWLSVARLHVGSLVVKPSAPDSYLEDVFGRCGIRMVLTDGAQEYPGAENISFLPSMSDCLPPRQISAADRGKGVCDCILIGSGSTGSPKAIVVPFGGVARNFENTVINWDFGPKEIFFSFVDLKHTTPMRIILGALSVGGSAYISGRLDWGLLDGFDKVGVTRIYCPVYYAERMVDEMGRLGRRLGDRTELILSSSIVTDSLLRRVKEHLTEQVSIMYGTNEVGAVTKLKHAWKHRPAGSVGPISGKAELQIVDDNHIAVAPGTPGHVRMKTPGMMSEYLGDSENTRKALIDGWFYPGDNGVISKEGHLCLLGRSDQMMIYRGTNIYPAEIERVLAEHPAVKDIAVLPMKHRLYNDIPICGVELHEGYSATEKSLQEFAAERLGIRGPQAVFVLESIPRNQLGKVIRKDLAEAFTARLKPVS